MIFSSTRKYSVWPTTFVEDMFLPQLYFWHLLKYQVAIVVDLCLGFEFDSTFQKYYLCNYQAILLL